MHTAPVPKSLLVGFEDQRGMFGLELRDALDMRGCFDDHFVAPSGLFSQEQFVFGGLLRFQGIE
jgi:hypothetical protein